MILHPDFTFVHLQKTGGSFVEDFLLNNIVGCKQVLPRHVPARAAPKDIFKFGCVRNPFDWYVSLWASHKDEPAFFEEIMDMDFKKFMYKTFNKKSGILHDVDFDVLTNLNIGMYTYRYMRSFYSLDGTFLLNAVIDMPFIKEGLTRVLDLNEQQINNLNSKAKVNTSDHDDYRTYYDDELIKLVEERDMSILDHYNYEF